VNEPSVQNMTARISEFDVLVPTARWLVDQGCQDMKISIANNQGRSHQDQKNEITESLRDKGFTGIISFVSTGPDLIARNNELIWKVECKGLSGGKNVEKNFHLALASVVSYYDEPDTEEGSPLKPILNWVGYRDRPIQLALALPHSDVYSRLLRKRVNRALRRRLKLWLLIVNPKTKSVDECYNPDREF